MLPPERLSRHELGTTLAPRTRDHSEWRVGGRFATFSCIEPEVDVAFRELHMVEIKEVLRLWSSGHGLRRIARRTGIDRKTVRRYLTAAEEAGFARGLEVDDDVLVAVVDAVQPGGSSEVGCMRSHLRAHAEPIQDWANQGCRGPKLVKLIKRKTGVSVPLRTMQRFLAEDLDLGRHSDTIRIVDPDPGVLEIDFLELGTFSEIGTGETRKMYALLCTAACSRHQFLWPCLAIGFDDVVNGLEAAWDFFGGVFPVLLPDNMKAIVKKADAIEPLFTDAFIEYAQARGFETDPARVGKPKDKARVERQVRYVRDDYFRDASPRAHPEASTGSLRRRREVAAAISADRTVGSAALVQAPRGTRSRRNRGLRAVLGALRSH